MDEIKDRKDKEKQILQDKANDLKTESNALTRNDRRCIRVSKSTLIDGPTICVKPEYCTQYHIIFSGLYWLFGHS